MAKANERPVIVCTEHRGVFFGYLDTKGAADWQAQEMRTLFSAMKEAGFDDETCRAFIASRQSSPTVALKRARMAISFGTTRGVLELAETGPTSRSKISARADIPYLPKVTSVFDVTPEAVTKWEAA